jgi:DNA-binding transcriptional MerR regulator
VIRQELSSPVSKERRRRRGGGLVGEEDEVGLAELCERAGITPQVARELEEFGLLEGTARNGDRRYGESDVEIAIACARLSHFGVAPRHLRIFRTAADREAALLEQLVAPALRSRHPERRQAGLDDLAALADLTQELSQLLFRRGLRRLAV